MATVAEQIQELYIGLLGRAADEAGADYWKGQIDSGAMTIGQVRANIVQSQPEYQTGLGALSREDALTELYSRMFERAPDAEGQAYWLTGAGKDVSFDQLVLALVNGAVDADKAVLANKTEAAVYYTAAAGTNYTDASAKAATDSVDATAQSVTDSKNATDTSFPSGSTFALTTDADPIVGTSANDVITGSAGTLNDEDLISDASSTDNDTLNVTLDEDNVAATISGIENINVNLDVFAGTDATFDAENTSGATITLSSTKLGFDGAGDIDDAGDNNVTAGTNITDLTVTGVEAGVVDTGSADDVAVTTAAATDVANVTVNGDVNLTVTTATEAAITATAASTVTLIEGGAAQVTDVTVTGDATLSLDADDADGDTVTGAAAVALTTATATAYDFTGLGAVITLDDDFGGSTSAEFADAASVTFAEAQTGTLVFAGDATNNANTLTVNTAFDVLSIDVQDNGLTTTVNATDDVTVGTLEANGENVVLTGSGDVVVATSNAAEFDATAFTGDLEYTTTVGAAIVGGTGANTIVTADADSSYTGQDGVDAVDASALDDTTLAVVLGAGDDSLTLASGSFDTATLVADFGAGTDTLVVDDTTDISTGTVTLAGLEVIDITEVDNSNVTFTASASTLSGATFTISSDDTDADGDAGLVIAVVAAGDTAVDLSTLTLTNINTVTTDASAATAAVTITGSSTDDIITGSGNGGDVITGGAGDDIIINAVGANTLTGDTGADTFRFAELDSTEADTATITDFDVTEFDVLDLSTTTIAVTHATGSGIDVSSASAESGTDIDAIVTNGIITLEGADAAEIDTLAEWLDVVLINDVVVTGNAVGVVAASSAAFEFNGNTYVVQVEDTGAAALTIASANVIELTDLVGVVGISATAATGTLVVE